MQDENQPTEELQQVLLEQRRQTVELQCSVCGTRMPYSAKGNLYISCRACGADVLNLPIHAHKEGTPARVPKKGGVFLGFAQIPVPLDLDVHGGDCLLCQEPTSDARWIGLVALGDKSPTLLVVGPFCRACVEHNGGIPARREWSEVHDFSDPELDARAARYRARMKELGQDIPTEGKLVAF